MRYIGVASKGSSPLTRGAQAGPSRRVQLSGLIPAYAGSTGARVKGYQASRAHPRLRGEHAVGSDYDSVGLGSSPLTRGARCHWREYGHGRGLIPAYAGST